MSVVYDHIWGTGFSLFKHGLQVAAALGRNTRDTG